MKRFLSVFMLICMLFVLFMPSFAAFAQTEADSDDETDSQNGGESVEDILQFTCKYDTETKQVSVSGTMNHDAFALHNKSSLVIYAVPPGMSEYEVALAEDSVPLGETSVSIKFGFNFNAHSLKQRYSRYAIFLRSPDGKLTLGTEAQFADVPYTPIEGRKHFKGISGAGASAASYIDADSLIVPVYLDSLITKASSGYIYQTESGHMFFDRAQIDALDGQINSALASGAGVYIRLLLRSGGELWGVSDSSAEYILPPLTNENSLKLVHSATDFLTERYTEQSAGKISGIILGKGWDNSKKYNACTSESSKKYIELCAAYAACVANAARSVCPTVDIVMPFTGEGFSADGSRIDKSGALTVNGIIEGMIEYFEDCFHTPFGFSVLIESESVPFGITNQSIVNGINTDIECEPDCLCAACISKLDAYMASIENKYTNVPSGVIYMWSVPASLSSNALSAAYAYSYHALLGRSRILSFTADFSGCRNVSSAYDDVANLIKYIDTVDSAGVSRGALALFGKITWNDVKGVIPSYNTTSKLIYVLPHRNELDFKPKGSFSYFDFSDGRLGEGWYMGSGALALKSESIEKGVNALRTALSFKNDKYAELIYKYEYHENMQYTPYMEFDLQLDGESGALYEVMLSGERDGVRYEVFAFAESGKRTSVIFDISDHNILNSVNSLRISVRPLSGSEDDAVLWLYGVKGHSRVYTDEQLISFISSERNKTNKPSVTVPKSTLWGPNTWIAIGILAATGIITVAVYFNQRRDGKGKKDTEIKE